MKTEVPAAEGKPTVRGQGFRLYELRHTCAILLLLSDVPAKIIFERLGHGSITLTLDTYSHVLPTMEKRGRTRWGSCSESKTSARCKAAKKRLAVVRKRQGWVQ